jgi:ActR/RegA family two-component response regulator
MKSEEVIEVSTQGKLLIVDDELSVRDSLGKWFREEGYEVGHGGKRQRRADPAGEHRWDAALVDIKMHGTDGIELQRRMHEIDPELIVIMMTGYASVETAVAALKNGAYDYVTKPLDPDEIAHLVKNALAHKRTEQENVLCARPLPKSRVPGTCRPERPHAQGLRRHRDGRPTDATVLVTGESGTGKGTGGARDPSGQPAKIPSSGGDSLRRADRNASGKRTLRARERRVHRRAVSQERQIRNRRGWNGFPRRDRRHQPEDPDRSAARAAGTRNHESAAIRLSRWTSAASPPPTRIWKS